METTPPPYQAAAGRDNNINPLRLALAALVLWSHSYALLHGGADSADEPIVRLTHGQMSGGTLAVVGFFVLSGYLIAQSWCAGRGLAAYLGKRARRIYPGFVVSSLLCVTIVPPLTGRPWSAVWSQDWPTALLRLAFLRQPELNGKLNGSTWTIQYEMLCYALLAVLGLLGILRRPPLVFGLTALAFVAYLAQLQRLIVLDWLVPDRLQFVVGSASYYPRFALAFLAGVLYYTHRDRIPRSPRLLALALLALGATAILGGFALALPVVGGYALLYLAFARIPRLAGLGAGADLSYGVYLYAWPLQLILIHRWDSHLTPPTLAALTATLVVAPAWLSWHLVERPGLRGRTGRTTRRDAATLAPVDTRGRAGHEVAGREREHDAGDRRRVAPPRLDGRLEQG